MARLGDRDILKFADGGIELYNELHDQAYSKLDSDEDYLHLKQNVVALDQRRRDFEGAGEESVFDIYDEKVLDIISENMVPPNTTKERFLTSIYQMPGSAISPPQHRADEARAVPCGIHDNPKD